MNDKVKALREAIAQKLAAAKAKTVTLFLVHSPEEWVWACHPKQLAYVIKEFIPIYIDYSMILFFMFDFSALFHMFSTCGRGIHLGYPIMN